MTFRRAAIVCALQALLLTACAIEPNLSPDGGPSGAEDLGWRPAGGSQGGPRGGRLHPLFISPAGEPLHGAPDGPAPVAAWFAQADSDHDGRLTRTEFTADYDRFFRQLDANGDGVIDGFESQAYERKIAPELLPQIGRLRAGEGQDDRLFKGGGRGGGGAGRGGRGGRGLGGGGFDGSKREGGSGPGGQGAGAYQFFADLEPITAADANLDGKVTLAEWRARAKAVFAQLDAKETGFLTLESLPKTPQQLAIEKRKAAQDKRRSP